MTYTANPVEQNVWSLISSDEAVAAAAVVVVVMAKRRKGMRRNQRKVVVVVKRWWKGRVMEVVTVRRLWDLWCRKDIFFVL